MESFPLMFMSFFAMANPVGNLPIFVGLTQGRSVKQVRRVGLITTLSFFIICVISMLLGEALLRAFGISLAAFRTAGGLLIALIGLRMLLGAKETASYQLVDHNSAEESPDAVGVVPMALPIMAGPGLISTVILHSHGALESLRGTMVEGAAILAVTGVVCAVLMGAPYLTRLLGKNGMIVLTKVMGLFLTAMGTQFVFIGLKNAFPG